MPTQTERDEVIQFVVLWRTGQSVSKPALDGIRDRPRWTHLGRVAALTDRGVDCGLGHVGVHRAGDWSPLVVLGCGPRQAETEA
jgi:hypothetical protein